MGKRIKPQWSDKYEAEWYKHWDGIPPMNDDNDYRWNGSEWVMDELLDRDSDLD